MDLMNPTIITIAVIIYALMPTITLALCIVYVSTIIMLAITDFITIGVSPSMIPVIIGFIVALSLALKYKPKFNKAVINMLFVLLIPATLSIPPQLYITHLLKQILQGEVLDLSKFDVGFHLVLIFTIVLVIILINSVNRMVKVIVWGMLGLMGIFLLSLVVWLSHLF